jgi:hypothetical protein
MRQKKTYGDPKWVDEPYGMITMSQGSVGDNKSIYRLSFCCMYLKYHKNIANCLEVI